MSTFYMYSPAAEQRDKESHDLSTLKNFTCAVNAETGESMISIELHEDNIEIKCPFDAAPIQTLGQEEREQYIHIICDAALSVYYNTRQVMNQNTEWITDRTPEEKDAENCVWAWGVDDGMVKLFNQEDIVEGMTWKPVVVPSMPNEIL